VIGQLVMVKVAIANDTRPIDMPLM
jgi:hypothetical protein